jgi:hypothetical protein
MGGAKIPGLPVAFIAAGSVLIYSGVENQPVATLLRGLARGQKPTPGPPETFATAGSTAASAASAAAGDTSAHGASAAANQAIGRVLAAPYGWSAGQQWDDLVSLWNQESGWSNVAKNPTSGAYGIAQALPPTKYPAAGQESGGSSATAQISWGLAYIKATYGSPSEAWAHEVADGWY